MRIISFLALALFACGGSEPPPRVVAAPPVASAECDGPACTVLGMKLSDEGKAEQARAAFKRGCEGSPSSGESCAAFALMLVKGEGGPKDDALAASMSEKSCNADDAGGCLVHGLLARDGQGTPKDKERAILDLDKACRRGLEQACIAKMELAPPSPPKPDSDAEVSVESMTVGGLTITNLRCKLESASGGHGMLAMGATLASRSGAMKECVKKATDVSVRWSSKGQIATDIQVDSSDVALKSCVERALAGSTVPLPCTCSATVHLAP
jgi:hypothetical protein